ncbi:MAG: secondary thiamine-phosphate synthase enzyme YjbQ [Candidatus Margulisbacteria bacterium]|nr:secondary thiamine-phosphate synthase enzyme YjbQ [Candidatus Margulisiibacteriota bacterium]
MSIKTSKREEIVDITKQVQDYISQEKIQGGIVTVFSPHTTAGITVNENADPDVKRDLLSFLNKEVPQNYGFEHSEGNSDAHIKGSLMNFSQSFIIEDGRLQLGTWQGIYFMEFDGPRKREIWLKISF